MNIFFMAKRLGHNLFQIFIYSLFGYSKLPKLLHVVRLVLTKGLLVCTRV